MAEIAKNVKTKYKVFKVFGSLAVLTSKQNSLKNVSRPIKNEVKNGSASCPFLMDFGINLDRVWEGFGGQVGANLGPNATKT